MRHDHAPGDDGVMAIVNGSVATGDGLMEPGTVLVRGERIAAVGPAAQIEAPPSARRIAATDRLVLPGFIDVRVPVCPDREADGRRPHELSRRLLRSGVTRFLPATAASSAEQLRWALGFARPDRHGEPGAQPMGLRLELPLGVGRNGGLGVAQAKQLVLEARRSGTGKSILVVVGAAGRGATELISWAAAEGLVAGMTVADADYERGRRAFEAGARYAAGVLDGLDDLHHRKPGAVAAALLDDRVTVEVPVADDGVGCGVASLFMRAKGAERCVLCSGRRAGTGSGMLEAVATASRLSGVGVLGASRMASASPAALWGLGGSVGCVAPGMTADLVLVTRDFEVVATIVRGALAYH